MTDQPTAPPPSAAPPAAWYDDPDDPTSFRYWDGAAWTDHRSPKRVAQPAVQAESSVRPVPTEPAPIASSPTYPAPISPAPTSTGRPAAGGASDWPLLRLVAVIAAIAIMIGSVTTWASVSAAFMSVDINGTDGDGTYTLFGGIAILVLVLVRKYFGAIIVGLVTGGVLIADLADVAGLVDDDFAAVSVGWGLYLATAGAVVAVVSLIALEISERSQPGPS